MVLTQKINMTHGGVLATVININLHHYENMALKGCFSFSKVRKQNKSPLCSSKNIHLNFKNNQHDIFFTDNYKPIFLLLNINSFFIQISCQINDVTLLVPHSTSRATGKME